MAENDQAKIIAFDTIFTTNHIQILKILLTYVEPSGQKHLAVYIKLLELQYTLSFFKLHPASSLPEFPHEKTFNASKLCDEIFPLCSRSEQGHLKQMKEMYQNIENLQEMMQMMQMMREMFPEGTGVGGENSVDFLSALSGMAGMSGMPDLSGIDLSQIFEMFQSGNNQQEHK